MRGKPKTPGRADVIDLCYQHRVDPEIQIKKTVGAMSHLVKQGKMRFLGVPGYLAPTPRG